MVCSILFNKRNFPMKKNHIIFITFNSKTNTFKKNKTIFNNHYYNLTFKNRNPSSQSDKNINILSYKMANWLYSYQPVVFTYPRSL